MNRRAVALVGMAAWLAACGSAPTPPVPMEPQAAPTPPTPAEAAPPKPAVAPTFGARATNGLDVRLLTTSPDATAFVQLGALAGAAFLAPGAAELTLHALASAADPTNGRPSLQQRIEALGGTLALGVGPLTAWFDVRVPGPRWREALAALADAVAAPPPSRAEFERVRIQLAAARRAALQTAPAATMAQLLLLGETDADSYLRGLLDRDVSEAAMFAERGWRPATMTLALEVAATADEALAAIQTPDGLGSWQRAGSPPPLPVIERSLASGLWWSPATDEASRQLPCRVAALFPLPNAEEPTAAEDLATLSCLTLDGLGGRLERTFTARGLGEVAWRARAVATPDATALLLECEAPAADVGPIWRALEAARASLRENPPDGAEMALARGRAPLLARIGLVDDGARVRRTTAMAAVGTNLAAFDARARALEAGAPAARRAAVERFLKRPFALVVAGGEIAADVPGVRRFGVGRTDADAPPTGEAPATAAGATKTPQPWLARAALAVGGDAALGRLAGWRSEAVRATDGAPSVAETIEWSADGTLTRAQGVLGQTVTTTLAGDVATESLGASKRTLDAAAAARLRREQRRHPLALLAAHARGDLPFRMVSMREDADRRHAVLEAAGGDFERLRVHVDTQSCLVRVVESWETLADGSVVHWRETWQDYRAAGPLRAPFHRMTTQDDGRGRVATSWAAWTPTLRPE